MIVMRGDDIERMQRTLDLPRFPGPARERAILDIAVQNQHDPIEWTELQVATDAHAGVIYVMADALKLKAIRLTATAETEQKIADTLGCLLMTPRILNDIWKQATIRFPPVMGAPAPEAADTKWMIMTSRQIDGKIDGRKGLIGCLGKNWVLTNRFKDSPGKAANYGWFDPSAPNGVLWQQLELKHDIRYQDYGQTIRLVRKDCVIDGVARDLREVFRDKELSHLVSNEGPLRVVRQPGVVGQAGPLVGERLSID